MLGDVMRRPESTGARRHSGDQPRPDQCTSAAPDGAQSCSLETRGWWRPHSNSRGYTGTWVTGILRPGDQDTMVKRKISKLTSLIKSSDGSQIV